MDTVITKTCPEKKQHTWASLWSPVAVRILTGAVVVCAVAVPAFFLVLKSEDNGGYTARGNANIHTFSVSCLGAEKKDSCQHGDKLVFRVKTSDNKQYFSAFCRNEANGSVIWFFPSTADGKSLYLTDMTQDGVIQRGIVIDQAFEPGIFEVFGLFSATPLTRDDVRAAFEESDEEPAYTIHSRSIRIVK